MALAENFPQDEFFLVSDQPFDMPHTAPLNLRRGGGPRNPAQSAAGGSGVWTANSQRLEAGLFHGTDFAVPYLPRRPSVLTLHDLSPWMDAAWHSNAGRVRQRTPVLIGLGLATMIVTPSEAVRKQAIERFRIHPDRIRAIPHAASACFRPRSAGEMAQRRPDRRIFCTPEPWSRARTFQACWPPGARCAARIRWIWYWPGGADAISRNFPPSLGCRLLGEVSDARLAQLLAGTLAFVYPSFYEGFGLPVLEAMQCGACVITSRDPAITEVAAGAALQAGSHAELVRAMLDIAAHPEWAEPWRERGLRRAAEFSWRRTAQLTHEVYEEAQRRF